jgi:hypothetical protein
MQRHTGLQRSTLQRRQQQLVVVVVVVVVVGRMWHLPWLKVQPGSAGGEWAVLLHLCPLGCCQVLMQTLRTTRSLLQPWVAAVQEPRAGRG